ncbi:unnamed protein product [Cyclocybe aegerita]|uniref:DUF6699 domain-containing protein n=1 Tax=Cyclocybe aegerita TaxID=1973307 RepID=A0A8S0VV93_CYCAE|nr:unnamed protein product [Cyclocybe aegerita]
MSDSPINEPFIPPSPLNFLPKNEPPRLPTPEMQVFSPPHDASLTIYWRNPRGWQLPGSPWMRAHLFHPHMPFVPLEPAPMFYIHRHLCQNFANPDAGPELLWDLIHEPDFARIRDPKHFKRWIKPDFDAEALQPSVKKVWVFSDHPVLAYWMTRWGHITIESDKVTVRDVLQAISDYLHMPLTKEDIHDVSAVPGNREHLRFARAQRAKDSYEVESVVLSSGYKRIDVLGGHRRFKGIHILIFPDETWRMYVGLLPGPVPRVC